MQRLLYISTARQKLEDHVLDEILRVSRRNNGAVGVTGLLVVGGRRFLQALEGPDEAVAQVFNRIARDPRHLGVVRLSTRTVETRLFGDWAMGFQHGGSTGADGSLADIVARLIEPIDDIGVRAEFAQFAQLHAAA